MYKRPSYLLQILWLCCLAACVATAWLALRQPWLGVQMSGADGKVRVTVDYSQQIPPGAEVRSVISATGATFVLDTFDLSDNSQLPADFAAMEQFYRKQDGLLAALRAGEVRLLWRARDGAERTATFGARPRPLSSLPAMFWFILAVACLCCMISAWVLLLRPQDWGARMFALSGLALFAASIPAAYLSASELVLGGQALRFGLALNYLGTFIFGGALIALFLSYPRQLVTPRALLWLPAVILPWFLAEQLALLPGPGWGIFAAIPTILLLAFAAAALQWRLTRKQPLERASLRWFLLSIFVACSLFTLTNVVPALFGRPALLQAGYSIGFFLIMYGGIALGLRRYRLFDMDEWAYRVLLWVAGATAVIALDGALLFAGIAESASLGISLLLCGWLYFPFRQWLWQRIVDAEAPQFENLLPELSRIAFTASASEQQARWEQLLRRIFDPLEMRVPGAGASGGLREDGLALVVPGCCNLPGSTMRYAGRGARLFSTRDAEFAAALLNLLKQIMSGRSSYEQGVAQERLRIGRDLHDNIGARLLKLIHHLRGTPDAEVARDAMKDLRTAIAAMDSRPVPLADALADWRAEAGARCEAAGCRLRWQQNDDLPDIVLPPRSKAMLESVLREIVTNALKHATPDNIGVEISAADGLLQARVENDGMFGDPLNWKEGYGLRNLRGRLEELGGGMTISCAENTVALSIRVALA